jgi:hypothetical protein
MGVPASEVGYTSATTGRGDHEVHKGHVVALKKSKYRMGLSKKTYSDLKNNFIVVLCG